MLKTRVLTAIVLLAVLLPVLYLRNFAAFAVVATMFFGAAIWECFRLFNPGTAQRALVVAVVWTAVFAYGFLVSDQRNQKFWYAISVLIWVLRFAPSLRIGLPPLSSGGNTLLSITYAIAIVGCFVAIIALFNHSPVYLLSVMALVWIADIGAYFSGKAFGKHKLAPSISPGKSWEGAIGGCVAVIVLAAASVLPRWRTPSPRTWRPNWAGPRCWSSWCSSLRRASSATCSNHSSSAAPGSRTAATCCLATAECWTGSTP
jgi:phosphatidate cytidylyltransferase